MFKVLRSAEFEDIIYPAVPVRYVRFKGGSKNSLVRGQGGAGTAAARAICTG